MQFHAVPVLRCAFTPVELLIVIAAVYAGMMIAISPADWTTLVADSPQLFLLKFLEETAAYAQSKRFLKSTCGPKKPPPKCTGGLHDDELQLLGR